MSFSPETIARRFADVTGDTGASPDIRLGSDTLQDVYIGLADDRTASTAVVVLSRYSKHRTARNGQDVPEWSGGRYAHIGDYNPATKEWVLYPEYVEPDEQAVVAADLESQAEISHMILQEEARYGFGLVDMRHAYTESIRKEMAAVLAETGLAKRLIFDNPSDFFGNERWTDDFTNYTFALTPNLCDPGNRMAFDQTLSVSYQGLGLKRVNGTTRADQYVHIASRVKDDPEMWVPDLGIISFEEWELIAHLPHSLLEYKTLHPDFSAEHCAVVQNYDH